FFFSSRRRHTRSKRDWSSDVCSSDLPRLRGMLHLFAFPATMVAGLVLVALGESLAIRLACVIFVVTAGLLFGVSATYHRGTWSPQRAIMLRRFDHAKIFLILKGTYTPISVVQMYLTMAVSQT